ncbi:MAG: cell envelope integrity protein CreD [Spirosomataceae bacterium]
MENHPQSPSALERVSRWISQSVMLKLFVVGFLMLLLLIPTAMLQDLIHERQATRDTAVSEITSKWGTDQTVSGPVISIPYETEVLTDKGTKVTETAYAHFLPENLNITGSIVPEKRYRGIYVVMLYNAKIKIEGTFKTPELSLLKIPADRAKLNEAVVSLGLTDLKGIKEAVKLQFGNQALMFNPGVETRDLFYSGVSVPIRLEAGQTTYKFSCELNLNGSSEVRFMPFGRETNVHLRSSWGTPSFVGAFSPDHSNISDKGFTADWKVLQYNRNYPQQGTGSFIGHGNTNESDAAEVRPVVANNPNGNESGEFGVKLLLPINEYQKTMRSVKYAAMFILITFTAFFFIEILNRRKLHPVQYLLVGFAICLFYVLLLSISEHLSFQWAYLIGCVTILALVSFYTHSIFKNTRLTLIFNGVLVLLYGFFYSLLQMEDYSLLLGSIGLLLILGTVMYLTRNIDWYRVYERKEGE